MENLTYNNKFEIHGLQSALAPDVVDFSLSKSCHQKPTCELKSFLLNFGIYLLLEAQKNVKLENERFSGLQ